MERDRGFNPESYGELDPQIPASEDPNPEVEKRNAFSYHSRQIIKERAGGVSEISGENTVKMNAAHLYTHDKKSPIYDNPENGLYTTVPEHLILHILTEGCNGLRKSQNRWSIETLMKQVTEEYGEDYLYDVLSPESMTYRNVHDFLIELKEKQLAEV